jgi:hypothetical protein
MSPQDDLNQGLPGLQLLDGALWRKVEATHKHATLQHVVSLILRFLHAVPPRPTTIVISAV